MPTLPTSLPPHCTQVASALAHLHRHGVAHLDVKPDNIYLQDLREEELAAAAAAAEGSAGGGGGYDGGSGGGGGAVGMSGCPVRYKLGDFGQATRLDLRSPLGVEEGDSRYLPLEVLRGELGQLQRADMFALGATLLELATRRALPENGPQYAELRAGRLPLLPTCSKKFAAVIRCGCRLGCGAVGVPGSCRLPSVQCFE